MGGHMPDAFYEKMWHTIKDEKRPFYGEVENIQKSGAHVWQELHISPILGEKGDIKFFIGVEPDITAKVRKEQLQKEFLTILSHQLRGPLTAERWDIEAMIEQNRLTSDQMVLLKDIYSENKNLGQLVADLFVLSAIQGNGNHVEYIGLVAEVQNGIEHIKKKPYRCTD